MYTIDHTEVRRQRSSYQIILLLIFPIYWLNMTVDVLTANKLFALQGHLITWKKKNMFLLALARMMEVSKASPHSLSLGKILLQSENSQVKCTAIAFNKSTPLCCQHKATKQKLDLHLVFNPMHHSVQFVSLGALQCGPVSLRMQWMALHCNARITSHCSKTCLTYACINMHKYKGGCCNYDKEIIHFINFRWRCSLLGLNTAVN